ncbi:RPII140-upstream gene protein [Schistocerca nitens]|uniref:RPII140-upstream gene protein n=1 Tax=Schistocerca nitens TaxID=7011 RepID=UPI002119A224|nr:RPII140-upstream gene protein [Schistocerca nitens]
MLPKSRVVTFLGGLLPTTITSLDSVDKEKHDYLSLYKSSNAENGWDRVRMMFSTDEFGNISPEVFSVLQTAFFGSFLGGCYGGFLFSRKAYVEFIERNQATSFTSHLEAKRQLQNHVTVNFAKGALKWAWRVGFFSSSYVLLSTMFQTYRGESRLVDYVAAGGITGACYRLHLGVRGFLVGGLLGCVLGVMAGGSSMLLLTAAGTSVEEVRFWQYKWKTSRDTMKKEQAGAARGYDDPLIKWHDEVHTKDSNESTQKSEKQ